MRRVFFRGSRVAAACLLIAVLLAPGAYASGTTVDVSLWAEFLLWLEGRIGIPPGLAVDDTGFTIWLMGRLVIPNG